MFKSKVLDKIPPEVWTEIIEYVGCYADLQELKLVNNKFESLVCGMIGVFAIHHVLISAKEDRRRLSLTWEKLNHLIKPTVEANYKTPSRNISKIFINFCETDELGTDENKLLFKTVCNKFKYVVIEYHHYENLYKRYPMYRKYDEFFHNISSAFELIKYTTQGTNLFHIDFLQSMNFAKEFEDFDAYECANLYRQAKASYDLGKPEPIFDLEMTWLNHRQVFISHYMCGLLTLYSNQNIQYNSQSKELVFNSRSDFHSIDYNASTVLSPKTALITNRPETFPLLLDASNPTYNSKLITMDMVFVTSQPITKKAKISAWLRKKLRKLKFDGGMNTDEDSDKKSKHFTKYIKKLEIVVKNVSNSKYIMHLTRTGRFIIREKKVETWEDVFENNQVNENEKLSYLYNSFIIDQRRAVDVLPTIYRDSFGFRPELPQIYWKDLVNHAYQRQNIQKLYQRLFKPLFSSRIDVGNGKRLNEYVTFIRFKICYNEYQIKDNINTDLEMAKEAFEMLSKIRLKINTTNRILT
ncbi:hypothetical protein WICMUC_003073 [Wickerhamomyces mucosus]|uniref:F-box domain-containing protein n=1 Tax=Wickerhamomyces mucosus TaxID=1378264 RepID=A0A9P8PME6_9ASCO|nr:hypothetical protein WICMUC_003073 [Wickerhamomyces mucosus]